jgi:hypothetical protein
MRKIEYDIKFDKEGEAYIVLSPDYEDSTEDKFMLLYLTTNLLEIAYDANREEDKDYEEGDEQILESSIVFLDGITYELSQLLKSEMDVSAEIKKMVGDSEDNKESGPEWDVEVDKIGDRNDLPDHNIIYKDNIYERKENDFKVYVKSTKKMYHLVGGITNNHWKVYKKK